MWDVPFFLASLGLDLLILTVSGQCGHQISMQVLSLDLNGSFQKEKATNKYLYQEIMILGGTLIGMPKICCKFTKSKYFISFKLIFKRNFGPLNFSEELDHFEIIGITATGLHEYGSSPPSLNKEVWEYINNLPGLFKFPSPSPLRMFTQLCQEARKTRILLTHIPLYRSPSASCGEVNKDFKVRYDQGYSYLFSILAEKRVTCKIADFFRYFTMVDKDHTQKLLDQIKPKYVFSGDIHENCELVRDDGTREVSKPL